MSNRLSNGSYDDHSDFQDLNDDIDNIYYNYVNQHGKNSSDDTLDSETHRAAPPITDSHSRLIPQDVLNRFTQESTLPVHISSRLSSLKRSNEDVTQSAPQTPNSNTSFDFHPINHLAMSNASLNILDTPTIEEDLKDILSKRSQNSQAKSTEALKSLTIDEEGDGEEYNTATINPATNGDDSDGIEYAKSPTAVLTGDDKDDWREKGAATVTRKISDASTGTYKVIRRSVQDFEFGKQLGEGSYSTVVMATDKITSVKYAVKILDKRHIIKEKKVKYVNIEKHALNRLSNRMGIISLYFTFQDKESLYFVLDYAANGELLSLIKKYGTLNEDCTRYFGAQILDAIRYMHENGVIHRDIKPENILLDDKLRVQITDFGTARLLEKKNDDSEDYPLDVRAKSFVGTAEYVSPELLENKYCGKPGDIWAFGCILYQMIAGKPPFKATNEYLTFQKITKLQYAFSAGFPMILRDLIKQILVLQPSRRATVNAIRHHYFFQDIDLDNYEQVWLTEPPELGPYKMSAKSMMKIPELTKSQSSQSVAVKRSQPKHSNGNGSNGNGNGTGTGNSAGSARRIASEPNGRSVNPATVAAFVLNKKEDPSDEDDLTSDIPETPTEEVDANLSKTTSRNSTTTPTNPSTPSSSRHPSTSLAPPGDYIPGTNILRPTINSLHSYRSTSSVKKKKSTKAKPKSKTLEVSPMTPLEVAWGQYLTHADERILKIGAVLASKMPTDYLEKKYKGLLHDSPLGFQNRSKSNSSFLTHVINGNGTGLRSGQTVPDGTEIQEPGDESDAIRDFYLVEEFQPPPASSESGDTSSSVGSKLSKFLKKIGLANNKERNTASEPVPQHPLDKQRTCTMLVTSHGRVLIFFRNDPDADYRLITEIKLNHGFIRFKEVVSTSSSKLLKIIPTTGIFVIQSYETSFAFEVEKYDVNSWTETLATAQTNQFERIKSETVDVPQQSNKTASPRLMESPEFTARITEDKRGRSGGESSTPKQPQHRHEHSTTSPHTHSKSPPPSSSSQARSHGHRESMFNSRLKSRSSVKRKPPPPMKNSTAGLDMSTGLGNNAAVGGGGMLHAAQLAVSNNSHVPITDNRHSSFTKEDRSSPGPSPPVHNQSHSKRVGRIKSKSPPPENQAITSKNSKLLARSHRKK